MKRPTIADIAQRAGVTKAAVSFALNGQPGVSAATRERILALAQEVGYQPSSAARALTAGKAGAYGLVAARPAGAPGVEPGLLRLVGAIQAELAVHQVSLLFTMAGDLDAEIDLYGQWWAQRRVDGVFVTGLRVDDRRIPAIEQLRLPAVVAGPQRGAGTLPAVSADERAAADIVVGHLAAQGHRRIARLGAPAGYCDSVLRREAFAAAAAAAGLAASSVAAGPAAEHGARAAAALLGAAEPPTAIFCDNDVLAMAVLGVAQRMGVPVPGQLSIVSGEDSALCELTYPALTALRADTSVAGSAAVAMLRELAAGGHPASVVVDAPALQIRASTARPGSAAAAPRRSRRTA